MQFIINSLYYITYSTIFNFLQFLSLVIIAFLSSCRYLLFFLLCFRSSFPYSDAKYVLMTRLMSAAAAAWRSWCAWTGQRRFAGQTPPASRTQRCPPAPSRSLPSIGSSAPPRCRQGLRIRIGIFLELGSGFTEVWAPDPVLLKGRLRIRYFRRVGTGPDPVLRRVGTGCGSGFSLNMQFQNPLKLNYSYY